AVIQTRITTCRSICTIPLRASSLPQQAANALSSRRFRSRIRRETDARIHRSSGVAAAQARKNAAAAVPSMRSGSCCLALSSALPTSPGVVNKRTNSYLRELTVLGERLFSADVTTLDRDERRERHESCRG